MLLTRALHQKEGQNFARYLIVLTDIVKNKFKILRQVASKWKHTNKVIPRARYGWLSSVESAKIKIENVQSQMVNSSKVKVQCLIIQALFFSTGLGYLKISSNIFVLLNSGLRHVII